MQTADEKILEGTGFITDLGMTGSHAGVIGFDSATSLPKFTDIPVRFEAAKGEERVSGIYAEFDLQSKQCTKIQRI